MSKNFEILKGLFGDQISELTEEHRSTLGTKLDNLIEARVDAKVKFQTEVIEEEAKEKYQKLLTEATSKFKTDVKTVEEQTISKATGYKSKLQEQVKKTIKEITEKKKAQVAQYKKVMVEKLDKYLNYELERRIPNTYVEEAAKASIFEPMIVNMKKIFEENGIKLDDENYGIIREARREIIKVREELAETVKENMEITEQLKDAKRSMKISTVCEGLTDAQRERASKLLEGCDADEIDTKFMAIRDFIIEGNNETDEELKEKDEVDCKKPGKKVNKKSNVPVDEEDAGDVEYGEALEEEEDDAQDGVVSPSSKKADEPITESVQIAHWAKEFKRLSGLK